MHSLEFQTFFTLEKEQNTIKKIILGKDQIFILSKGWEDKRDE